MQEKLNQIAVIKDAVNAITKRFLIASFSITLIEITVYRKSLIHKPAIVVTCPETDPLSLQQNI